MNSRRIAFHTLGCKLNYAETAALELAVTKRGYTVVADDELADIIIINSCTVTDNADVECRKIIRKALRSSPDSKVAVTGCYAQLQPEKIASIEGVTAVYGTVEKATIADRIEALLVQTEQSIHVSNLSEPTAFVPARSAEGVGRTRAFLKIQDGCDYICTFCTIPKARGSSRAMELHDVMMQARILEEEGYKEVVLTGVNVGEYLDSNRNKFIDVLKALSELAPSYRVRVSSIEPNTLKSECIELIANSPVFAKHVHIPLQSGSAEILRHMKRRYNPDVYKNVIENVKKLMPNAAIGIDVIVGFPGETDELFEESFRFIESLPFTYLHVFTYSERANTKAQEMQDTVPVHIRKARTARLRALSSVRQQEVYARAVGTVCTVITELPNTSSGYIPALTENYLKVRLPLDSAVRNEFVAIKIHDVCFENNEPYCLATII